MLYRRFGKRALDILFAALAILLLSPLLAAIWLWVRLDSPGPVLFRQRRVGRGGSYFSILKFRTMYADTPADMPTHLLHDANARITRSGRFLRRYSLDELPQLFNILAGQMSFVGPRPALWNQEDLIALRAACGANDVTPGLTGLAQVRGRDELPIEIKARYDGEYAADIRFWKDVRILFATFFGVVQARGVVEGDGLPADEVPAAPAQPPQTKGGN